MRDCSLNQTDLSWILWTSSASQGSNNQLGNRCMIHRDTTKDHSYTADCTVCTANGFASAWQVQRMLCPHTSRLICSSACTASPLQVSEQLELGLLTTWILQLRWDCSEKPQFLVGRDTFFFFLVFLYFRSRTASLSESECNKVPAAAKLLSSLEEHRYTHFPECLPPKLVWMPLMKVKPYM